MARSQEPASMRSTEEQLAWEARQRPRAAAAAILAAVLTLGAGIYSGLVFRDIPRSNLLESLGRATGDQPIGGQQSLRLPFFRWYDDHLSDLVLGAVLTAAGALSMGGALTFLAFAVLWRRPEFPRGALYVPMIGAILLAGARILVAFGNDDVVSGVLAGPGTVDAVADLQRSGLLTTAQLIELAGTLALGLGLLLVALNAMRTGLLTRFMGVLGIISGVLFAFPVFGGPLPVVQSFWFFAVGLLFLGRWPGGAPPAWSSGRAIPWPSAAEQRAAREAKAGRGVEPGAPPSAEVPAAPATGRDSRKKRKRRG